MIDHLLGVGLSDVNDGKAIEVKVEDLGRPVDAVLTGRSIEM
jgi:hypothetical protein